MGFLDPGAVATHGSEIEKYGIELQELLVNFGKTIDVLREGGMKGAHAIKLANSYDEISPSLRKYADTIERVGSSVSKAAANTENATAEIAGKLNVS